MKRNKQNPDFLRIGHKLIEWYQRNSRDLPWRKTESPYKIWISEVVLQQTQVKQGLQHYLNFVERFPDVKTLSEASEDEVLLYWKGLGYYSRALNLHKASQQVMEEFNGVFPNHYNDILKLKGVGKYTAAAISSICFNEKRPAIDGNFYRVLSRVFADDFDVSQSTAFQYFSELALQLMPDENPGEFNQAIMDLGAEVCKPKNPDCEHCPINEDCLAYSIGKVNSFPVKTKKVKTEDLILNYFFVFYKNQFLIKQRHDRFIWKKLYEFPSKIPEDFEENITDTKIIKHKLTHKNLTIIINKVQLESEKIFKKFAEDHQFLMVTKEESHQKSFPKPLEKYIDEF